VKMRLYEAIVLPTLLYSALTATLTKRLNAAHHRWVQSRFAETLTLTLTLNPNFGESGFGEWGRHPQMAKEHLGYLLEGQSNK